MHRTLRLSLLCVALALAACASAPVTRVVLPSPDMPAANADPAPGITVQVREVRLPGYLDGFPVVVNRSGETLVVADKTEWGERPSQGATRVLRDALSQRLGDTAVLVPGDRRVADAELQVEFLALDPMAGHLVLDARWSLACRERRADHGGRNRLQVPVDGATPEAVAQATTRALVQFADLLAPQVRCTAPAAATASRTRSA